MPLLLLLLGLKANAECAKDNHYGDTRKHDKGAFLKLFFFNIFYLQNALKY